MEQANYKDIDPKTWEKKKKSKANILGYQPSYELLKMIFEIVDMYSSKRGWILKDELYQLIFQGEYTEKNYKTSFDNSISFLDQIDLIESYLNEDQTLLRSVKHRFSLNFELNFFNSLKNLDGLPKSPYILYEELIRKNIYIIDPTKLFEFSVAIQNGKNYAGYNINNQQIRYWIIYFEHLGAITRLKDNILLVPDYDKCLDVLKLFYLMGLGDNKNVELKQIIDFFEKNSFPILISDQENLLKTHMWFDQFIECLKMRKIIESLYIDDSEAYTVNNQKISNIEFRVELG